MKKAACRSRYCSQAMKTRMSFLWPPLLLCGRTPPHPPPPLRSLAHQRRLDVRDVVATSVVCTSMPSWRATCEGKRAEHPRRRLATTRCWRPIASRVARCGPSRICATSIRLARGEHRRRGHYAPTGSRVRPAASAKRIGFSPQVGRCNHAATPASSSRRGGRTTPRRSICSCASPILPRGVVAAATSRSPYDRERVSSRVHARRLGAVTRRRGARG